MVWYGMLCYGMVWKVWYAMRFQCYAMVYVVKDKHIATVFQIQLSGEHTLKLFCVILSEAQIRVRSTSLTTSTKKVL